ncbi:MAG: response regulator transcription factor [Gammaproteobacteria bacterium]|nr:response regulator transcription factor [Gammaproteobacteria bacterium]MBP9728759.1 response regulator transcription factor [Gammaproteobacteria bacterium]
MHTSPVSVFIADDHALVRQGLQGILAHTPTVQFVGEAQDGLEAVRLALRQKPDVVLMDLQMPHMNGLDATQKIVDKNSHIKIIILTSLEKPEHIKQAMQAGAHGYLVKNVLPQEMIQAIHTVAQGGYHFQHLSTAVCSPLESVEKEPGITKLSPKEKQVLKLIVEGHTIPTIARMLHRNPRTIRMHRENIRKKLDVKNNTQLILRATKSINL